MRLILARRPSGWWKTTTTNLSDDGDFATTIQQSDGSRDSFLFRRELLDSPSTAFETITSSNLIVCSIGRRQDSELAVTLDQPAIFWSNGTTTALAGVSNGVCSAPGEVACVSELVRATDIDRGVIAGYGIFRESLILSFQRPVVLTPATPFTVGDATNDRSLGIDDVLFILFWLMEPERVGPASCEASLDFDRSESIDISDAVSLVMRLFLNVGSPLPEPCSGERGLNSPGCASSACP